MRNQTETFEPTWWSRKLGVFEETVRGIVVGYFVGWQYRYGGGARNIRADLYFPTAESALAFRDSIEDARNAFDPVNIRQIG